MQRTRKALGRPTHQLVLAPSFLLHNWKKSLSRAKSETATDPLSKLYVTYKINNKARDKLALRVAAPVVVPFLARSRVSQHFCELVGTDGSIQPARARHLVCHEADEQPIRAISTAPGRARHDQPWVSGGGHRL